MTWYEIVTPKHDNFLSPDFHPPKGYRHIVLEKNEVSWSPPLNTTNHYFPIYSHHFPTRTLSLLRDHSDLTVEIANLPSTTPAITFGPPLRRRYSFTSTHKLDMPSPQVHIISHSASALTSRDPRHKAYARGRYDQAYQLVPKDAYYLYEINCIHMEPPPDYICSRFTGQSDTVKRYVMHDSRAKSAVNKAVENVLSALRRHRGVWLETRCVLGTHRSVAVAEIIGEELGRRGIEVLVQHPHVRSATWGRRDMR